MKKLVLLLLIAYGLLSAKPDLRERVVPQVEPAIHRASSWMVPRVRPLFDPVLRWSANGELRLIARRLELRQANSRSLPRPDEFQRFLEETQISGRGGLDPWGTPYYLVVTPDSFVVGSAGPDQVAGTEDDLRQVRRGR